MTFVLGMVGEGCVVVVADRRLVMGDAIASERARKAHELNGGVVAYAGEAGAAENILHHVRLRYEEDKPVGGYMPWPEFAEFFGREAESAFAGSRARREARGDPCSLSFLLAGCDGDRPYLALLDPETGFDVNVDGHRQFVTIGSEGLAEPAAHMLFAKWEMGVLVWPKVMILGLMVLQDVGMISTAVGDAAEVLVVNAPQPPGAPVPWVTRLADDSVRAYMAKAEELRWEVWKRTFEVLGLHEPRVPDADTDQGGPSAT